MVLLRHLWKRWAHQWRVYNTRLNVSSIFTFTRADDMWILGWKLSCIFKFISSKFYKTSPFSIFCIFSCDVRLCVFLIFFLTNMSIVLLIYIFHMHLFQSHLLQTKFLIFVSQIYSFANQIRPVLSFLIVLSYFH